MNIESYRNYCLSIGEDVEERMPFGAFKAAQGVLAFYVCGHIFCFFDIDNYGVVTLKCQPERVEELQVRYNCVGKPSNLPPRYWIGVDATAAPDDLLCELTLNSYHIVREKYGRISRKRHDAATTIYRYCTPDGFDDLLLRSDGKTLTGLWFEGSRTGDGEVKCVSKKTPELRDTCRWLDIYFSGRQPEFTPDYRIENPTPFRKQVLELICRIPYGRTATYGEIAAAVAQANGMTKMSAQAIGGAVGWNPIGIIVPCHRVIGANGNLTGYGGGMRNKTALLKLEGWTEKGM